MIILTGGAGFIGSCFLEKLNQNGENNIIVVDELGCDLKWKNLCGKTFIDYIEKNDFLLDLEKNPQQYKDVKAVFHIGACSSTTEEDCSYLVKNNFEYSKILAKWAISKKINFYYASSAATYGDGKLGYSDDTLFTLNLLPLNMYGYSKHLFDLWVIKNNLIKDVVGFKFF